MREVEYKFPVAEIFRSIQGEGQWAGSLMFFIRLAGCNVGKYVLPDGDDNKLLKIVKDLEERHSICTTFDGRQFLCDTDYHKYFELTATELLYRATMVQRVCITGGEPFANSHINELVDKLLEHKLAIHIETSGTKPIRKPLVGVWITCSPKEGFRRDYLEEGTVNEWKFLVDTSTDESKLRDFHFADTKHRPFYIQPINDIHTHNKENMKYCLHLLKRNPEWRLSAQLHKYLELP